MKAPFFTFWSESSTLKSLSFIVGNIVATPTSLSVLNSYKRNKNLSILAIIK